MTVLSTSVHSRTALICRAFSWVVTPSDVSIIVVCIAIFSVVVSADIVVVVLTLDWDVFKSFDVTVTEAEISDSCHNLCPEEDDVLMTNFVSSVVVDDVSDDSPNFHLVISVAFCHSFSQLPVDPALWIDSLIVMCDITLFESLVSSSCNAVASSHPWWKLTDVVDSSPVQKKKKRLCVLSCWTRPSSHHSEQKSIVKQQLFVHYSFGHFSYDRRPNWQWISSAFDRGRWSHFRKKKLWTVSLFYFFNDIYFKNLPCRTPQARAVIRWSSIAIVRQRSRE